MLKGIEKTMLKGIQGAILNGIQGAMLKGIQGAVLQGDMPLQRLAWKGGSSALTLDLVRCAPCLSGAAKQPSESASLSSMRACVSNHILLASCSSRVREAGRQDAALEASKKLLPMQ